MQPAVLIRLRPTGPWRSGPGQGGRDHADPLFGSDRLFSAVTLAMQQLGHLDEWLDATVRRAEAPGVVFTSLFPFASDALLAPPPATLWPPPPAQVTAPSPVFLTKLRWNAARFVPVTLVESILLGQNVLADQWLPDPQTGCLLRRDRPSSSPFRPTTRTAAAVDRISHAAVHVHSSACLEFEPGAGLWTVARFLDEPAQVQWADRVHAAFRLIADTGFGGKRSSGWGQTQAPELVTGSWPAVLMPKLARRLQTGGGEPTDSHWLLSLYSPSISDQIDWHGGDYSLTVRGGFVHGTHQAKKLVRLIAEGSVLAASSDPVGTAVDVAQEGAAHPVYRSGLAFTLRLPVIEVAPPRKETPVETPTDPEALEPPPCEQPQPESEQRTASEDPPQNAPETEEHLHPAPEPEPATHSETSQQPEAASEPQVEPESQPRLESTSEEIVSSDGTADDVTPADVTPGDFTPDDVSKADVSTAEAAPENTHSHEPTPDEPHSTEPSDEV